MATVEEVVKDIAAVAPGKVAEIAIAKWINNRYRELVTKAQFRNLQKVGKLTLPEVITTGTVSTTRGSTSVTGTGTTWTTAPGSGTQEHYFIRIQNVWYQIASVSGDTSLTLASPYAEDSATDASYEIVKRTHSLASDARWLYYFSFPRLNITLSLISATEMDVSYPGRLLAQSVPKAVCQSGVDSSNYVKVEIYPPPKDSELIIYSYSALPSDLTISSTIPPQIEAHILKEGGMIDLYRTLKIGSLNAGMIEAAGVYANEEAKQLTKWKEYVMDAARTARASDDISVQLTHFNKKVSKSDLPDLRSEYIWSR